MRILINGNTEITKEVERLDGEFYELNYTTGDTIIFVSDFPFNHLYVKLGTKNALPANMKVEYYTNTSWVEVVNLIDGTKNFTESGFIEFTPNKNSGWGRCDSDSVGGVSSIVYDKYWARITFDSDLTADIGLEFFGNKFSDDTDLFDEFPVFNDSTFLTAYKSGKTNWEEQHIKAAEIIINDLQKKGVVLGKEQILDRKRFLGASVQKVAEIIYNAFGNDYLNQKKECKIEYDNRMDLSQFNTDLNNDGILQASEKQYRQQWLSR
jgi:hypothetical protein